MLKFPLFAAYPNLVHGVFEKTYGNVGPRHSSQADIAVALSKIASDLKTTPQAFVIVKQVHGNKIINLDTRSKINKIQAGFYQADGLITNQKNIYLLIKTADCLPLFLFNPQKNLVGLIHVGWQSAVKKIHLHALNQFITRYKSCPNDIMVAIGPTICARCYYQTKLPQQIKNNNWKPHLNYRDHQWHVDLKGFVINELTNLGISAKNIQALDECTYEHPQKWFSYRRHRHHKDPMGVFANIIGIRTELIS